jgi:hypothetical protein
MSAAARYWGLVKLDSTGRCKIQEMTLAKEFFWQQFPQSVARSELQHAHIQEHLLALSANAAETTTRSKAQMCLRCFISHQIQQVCIEMEAKFGRYHGFTRQDLYRFVLDDDGRSPESSYQPLAVQILQTFDPERGHLAAWTVRLVKHHRELNAFLLESGLYLISDWAILNDTAPKKLERVFAEFYDSTRQEIELARALLESYHAVYRRDRLRQGQKGQCLPPSKRQLQDIGSLIQERGKAFSPEAILTQLQNIASRLRQYRVYVRSGNLPTQPLDVEADRLLTTSSSDRDEEDDLSEFLQFYRQQVLSSLEWALERAIDERLQGKKTGRAETFMTALQLFYCQKLCMSEIASQLELNGQYSVSRLLKLKEFRSDVRHWMLEHLKQYVRDLALTYIAPDRLQHLDTQLEAVLSEQIAVALEEAPKKAATPKGYASCSLLTSTLCHHLKMRKKK